MPDVAVFLWDRILRDANGEVANAFLTAPDWTIEILSPDPSQTRVTKNIWHGLHHETQMGWLMDPDEQTVFVYRPQPVPEVVDEPGDGVPVPSFARGLELTIQDLLAWLVA